MVLTLPFAEQSSPHVPPKETYLLGHGDVHAFINLQNSVCSPFVKIRTVESLYKHLEAGMPIIGVTDEKGVHIGHALLTFPSQKGNTQNIDSSYDVDGMEHTIAIMQAVLVDPNYKGVFTKIVAEAIKCAAEHGHTQIIAKVRIDNGNAIEAYEKRGFTHQGLVLDDDGVAAYIFRYNLTQQPDLLHNKIVTSAPNYTDPLARHVA